MFDYGTGRHWCESNVGTVSPFAEFYNTMSSSALLLIGCISLALNWEYFTYIRPSAMYWNVLWIIAAANTAYYHATLSLLGQILDELSLLWIIMFSIGIWAPGLPNKFKKKHMEMFQFGCFIVVLFCSILAFVSPLANAYFLMCFTAPAVAAIVVEVQTHKSRAINRLAIRATLIWFFGIFVWLLDGFACHHLLKIGFPYMHALWHIAAALGGYTACVMFIFTDAKFRLGSSKPRMSFALGIFQKSR